MNINFEEVDFKDSKFDTTYSFSSPRSIIRVLSDSFSKQFCNTSEAPKYAAEFTEGRCLYCGQPLYHIKGGKPTFSNNIHFDHIYPASKFNLFEVGNVALSCETCNLAKSDRLPMDYYDMRLAEETSLLIYERDEFEKFLNEMIEPYKNKWPKHYETNFVDLNDVEFKERLTELLYNEIDLASASVKYNHETSVNWSIWEQVVKRAYETYSKASAKDVAGRIGYTNELFEKAFGCDMLIQNCTLSELKGFINKLLLSKYESKNEIQKYRMLIKILIEILNEDLMTGQLEGFYQKVPTYSKINK